MFRLLLLGDSGVGKSCLILRYTVNYSNFDYLGKRIQFAFDEFHRSRL